jgi:poly-beta-1,6-N-acetyl-D-glucosamine synthase
VGDLPSYAVVTPARDEAANLRRIAESLRAQTLPPVEWLVVDNGSADETLEVVAELAGADPWIRVLTVPGEEVPTRGGPVARAFAAGVEALSEPSDVVVKLDADLTFEPGFFAGLMAEFAADERLGIAGGTCYEFEAGGWVPRRVTGSRVRGATRAYRRRCLADVLPLEDRPGWDGIDELRATARGWRTASFARLPFYHHRAVGQRDASGRRRLYQVGKATYYSWYRPSYLVLRALFNARHERAALAMIGGYAAAALRREPRCPDPGVRDYIRREQRFRAVPLRAREKLGL